MGEFICSYLQLFAVRGTYLYIKSKSFEMSRLSRHNKSFVKRDIEELTKALRKMKIEDDVHGRTGVKMAIIGCKRKGDNNDGHGVIKRILLRRSRSFIERYSMNMMKSLLKNGTTKHLSKWK